MQNKDCKSQHNKITFKDTRCLNCEGTGKIYFRFFGVKKTTKMKTEVKCDECNGTGKRDYNLIECIKVKFDRFVLFNENVRDKENEYFCIFVKDNPIKPIFFMPTLAIPSISKNENTNVKYKFILPTPIDFVDNFYVSHACWLFYGNDSILKMEL